MRLPRALPVFLILLLLGAGRLAAAIDIEKALLDNPVGVGALQLDSTTGKPLDAKSLANRWTFVALGYTSCPDVCPFTLGNLAAIETAIAAETAPGERPAYVFISVDPGRDDIETLRDYVGYFSRTFVGATGPRKEINRFISAADAFYRYGRRDRDGHYTVDHSALFYLIDPKARIAAKFEPPLKPEEAARVYSRIRARYADESKG